MWDARRGPRRRADRPWSHWTCPGHGARPPAAGRGVTLAGPGRGRRRRGCRTGAPCRLLARRPDRPAPGPAPAGAGATLTSSARCARARRRRRGGGGAGWRTRRADFAASVEASIGRWFRRLRRRRRTVVGRTARHPAGERPPSFLHCYEVFATADAEIGPELGRITVPALAVTGDLDPGSTPEMSRRLADAIPAAARVDRPRRPAHAAGRAPRGARPTILTTFIEERAQSDLSERCTTSSTASGCPRRRRLLRQHQPGHPRGRCTRPPAAPPPTSTRPSSRPRRLREPALAGPQPDQARAPAAPPRRPDRRARRGTRPHGIPGQRQAAARDARPSWPPCPSTSTTTPAWPTRSRATPSPRSNRALLNYTQREPLGVVGRHHPVELAADADHHQAGPGAGRRQHHGDQALRVHLAPPSCGWPSWPSRPASRRAWSTSSPASAPRPAQPWSTTRTLAKISFTGSTATGSPHRRHRRRRASSARTLELGGKSPEHRLRGRQRRQRRHGRRGRHLRRRRPDLHRRQPGLRAPLRLRRAARAGRRAGRAASASATRSRTPPSSARWPSRTSRTRSSSLRRPGRHRGRHGAHRRRPPRRRPRRLLLRAHRPHRRRQHHARRPRGDLRPRGGHHALRHRGGGPAPGQRHRVRPRRRACGRRTSPAPTGWPAAWRPARSGSTPTGPCPRCPRARASRTAAWASSTAWSPCRSTPGSRASGSTPSEEPVADPFIMRS